MGPFQRIARLQGVVEAPAYPCGGVVALTTELSKSAVMSIVSFVTVLAVCGGFLETGREMAGLARQ